MREVTVSKAKVSLSALLDAAAAGEEVVITKRSRPVARLVPIEEPKGRPRFGSAREAFERSGLSQEDIDRALAPMSEDELREWGLD
jgi:prevent-host-death family protein